MGLTTSGDSRLQTLSEFQLADSLLAGADNDSEHHLQIISR